MENNNGIVITNFDNPLLKEAEQRAEDLGSACHFNDAIVVIEQLIVEVQTMPIASRFLRDRPVGYGLGKVPEETRSDLAELPESEYKRQTLLIQLNQIKDVIILQGGFLTELVLNIEATKRDF